jgi:hypothetical protein
MRRSYEYQGQQYHLHWWWNLWEMGPYKRPLVIEVMPPERDWGILLPGHEMSGFDPSCTLAMICCLTTGPK